MKRHPRHAATRSLFGHPPRRRPALSSDPQAADRLLGALQLGGRSALSLAVGAVMLVFIGLLVVNFVGQVIQSAGLEARRSELEAEVAQMQAANSVIEGGVAFTESDVYVERVAREQLGYAREGETVMLPRLVAPAAAAAAAPALETPFITPTMPNWQLWWRALFPTDV